MELRELYKNASDLKLNLSYLAQGIYFIELMDKNGVLLRKGKMVKF